MLAATVIANMAMCVVALIGLLLDPRTVLSAPAWAKTLKFAISIAFYAGTLIWVLNQITRRPRLVRFIGNATGVLLLIEIIIIALQTARGVPSHFNAATPLDAALFSVMGIGITSMWAIDGIGMALLLRERLHTRAMTRAVKLGMLIALIGMALAFTMTAPNSTQIAALQAGQKLSMFGAHNVNAMVDGQTRMIPFLGWNRDGGDLRIAHFIGLHALQVLPLAALWLNRRRAAWLNDGTRTALVGVAALVYLGLTLLALWQALRNESIAATGTLILGGLAGIFMLAAVLSTGIIFRARRKLA